MNSRQTLIPASKSSETDSMYQARDFWSKENVSTKDTEINFLRWLISPTSSNSNKQSRKNQKDINLTESLARNTDSLNDKERNKH